MISSELFLLSNSSDLSINRIPHSSLHQRDPRASSSLFDSYNGERSQPLGRSPGGYGGYQGAGNGGHMNGGGGPSPGAGSFRPATPNSKYVISSLVIDSYRQLDTLSRWTLGGVSGYWKY
jgi:hypothetical protein